MLARFFGKFRKPDRPVLPQLLDTAEYEKLMPTFEFFPRPEWKTIQSKIERENPDSLDLAWQDFAHIWLTRLSYRLEGTYGVHRSDEFLLLTALDNRRAGFALNILDGIRMRLLDLMGWTKENELPGLYVVLLFADASDYLRYVSAFGEQREEEGSVGMFLPDAYGHMALLEQEMWRMESTFAYVLTQYILNDSKFPTWLRTGLSLHFSDLYNQGERITEIHKGEALAALRRTFWLERGLQVFWEGLTALPLGGDLGEAGFRERFDDLALSLTRLVFEEAKSVKELVADLSWQDAGFTAVSQHTGRGLDEIVSDLLGEGDWTFTPPAEWSSESP